MELIDDCVHCGFCLPSCPTYILFGEEMDSPRGRIYLMKEALEGEALSDTMVQHWDLCLGCLACVSSCPSGVQYEKLIGATRPQVERRHRRPWRERLVRELIYSLFPYPARLQALMAPLRLYQRLGLQSAVRRSLSRAGTEPQRLLGQLRLLEQLTPDVPARVAIQRWTPARGTQRRRVGVLLGCVQRAFFSPVNAATVRILSAEGCGVVCPSGQGCCGALSEHVGREEEALRFARRTIDTFLDAAVETVVVNVAGCGSMMKEYGYLLRDDPKYAERARLFSSKVRDVSEFLQELDPLVERHPLPMTAVYHDACHLAHGQQIRQQPRAVLKGIPELILKEIPRERDICCGSAGTYNLLQPKTGRELGERKARAVLDTGAQLLVAANPGCQLQIQASLRREGQPMPMAHVVEVLDASIQGVRAETFLQSR
jgi:glycolate oxidase iron-sulfur subunit